MTRKLIAVDVDLTLVDSFTPWLSWVRQTQGRDFQLALYAGNPNGPYTPGWITHYDDMPGFYEKQVPTMKPYDRDSFIAYWQQKDLYQLMAPVKGSVLALQMLAIDHDLVFVTHCFPGHVESKRKFLNTYFGVHDFVDTKEKHLINYDWIIDDNVGVMKKCLKRNPDKKHVFMGQVFGETILTEFGWLREEIKQTYESLAPGADYVSSWDMFMNKYANQEGKETCL